MTVEVEEARAARGYIGPCENVECDKPADWTLVVVIGGTRAHTWVCSRHRAQLALTTKAS